MRILVYFIDAIKCLSDTMWKQSPNQTALHKVLRLKGTQYDSYTMRLETHYTAILGMGEKGALEYNRNHKIIKK